MLGYLRKSLQLFAAYQLLLIVVAIYTHFTGLTHSVGFNDVVTLANGTLEHTTMALSDTLISKAPAIVKLQPITYTWSREHITEVWPFGSVMELPPPQLPNLEDVVKCDAPAGFQISETRSIRSTPPPSAAHLDRLQQRLKQARQQRDEARFDTRLAKEQLKSLPIQIATCQQDLVSTRQRNDQLLKVEATCDERNSECKSILSDTRWSLSYSQAARDQLEQKIEEHERSAAEYERSALDANEIKVQRDELKAMLDAQTRFTARAGRLVEHVLALFGLLAVVYLVLQRFASVQLAKVLCRKIPSAAEINCSTINAADIIEDSHPQLRRLDNTFVSIKCSILPPFFSIAEQICNQDGWFNARQIEDLQALLTFTRSEFPSLPSGASLSAKKYQEALLVIFNFLEASLRASTSSNNALRQERTSNRMHQNESQANIALLTATKERLELLVESLRNNQSDSESQIQNVSMKQRIAELISECTNLESKANRQKEELRQTTVQNSSLRSQLAERSRAITSYENEIEALKRSGNGSDDPRVVRLTEQLTFARSTIRDLHTEVHEHENTADKLRDQLFKEEESNLEKDIKIDELQAKYDALAASRDDSFMHDSQATAAASSSSSPPPFAAQATCAGHDQQIAKLASELAASRATKEQIRSRNDQLESQHTVATRSSCQADIANLTNLEKLLVRQMEMVKRAELEISGAIQRVNNVVLGVEDDSTSQSTDTFFKTTVPGNIEGLQRELSKLDEFVPEPTTSGDSNSVQLLRSARKNAVTVTSAFISMFDALLKLHKDKHASPTPSTPSTPSPPSTPASDTSLVDFLEEEIEELRELSKAERSVHQYEVNALKEQLTALKDSTKEAHATHQTEVKKLKGEVADHARCDTTISSLSTLRSRYQARCDQQTEVLHLVNFVLKRQHDPATRAPECDFEQAVTHIEEAMQEWEAASMSDDRDTTLAGLRMLLYVCNRLKPVEGSECVRLDWCSGYRYRRDR